MYPASMKVIGEMSEDGRSVELMTTDTDVMWRNVGDAVWHELCPKSEMGNSIITGIVDPSLSDGKPGDIYINTATLTFFGKKTSIGWPVGLPMKGTNATTTSTATTTTNGLMSSADKTKLDSINSMSASAVASGVRVAGTAFTISSTRNAWATIR